jgi:hypothetical protein
VYQWSKVEYGLHPDYEQTEAELGNHVNAHLRLTLVLEEFSGSSVKLRKGKTNRLDEQRKLACKEKKAC